MGCPFPPAAVLWRSAHIRRRVAPAGWDPHRLRSARVVDIAHYEQSRAQREHGLGLEALTAFVDQEPLWKVHQSVFAVLALESEPVDPRL